MEDMAVEGAVLVEDTEVEVVVAVEDQDSEEGLRITGRMILVRARGA